MSTLDPRISRWLPWLAPFALLALALGIQTGWGRDLKLAPLAETPVVPAPVTTAVAPEFRIDGGLDAMKSTVERPLFNATRRPAPPAVAEAAKPTIQRGQFVLTGTMITDQGAIAFLKETSGNAKSRSVKKGDSINGMVVTDVELKVAKGPKTTVQANPAAAAPAGAPVAAAPQGAPVAPVAGAAPTRRGPATQATAGATDDSAANVRNARRAAREAERQQAAGQAADGATNPTQPANSWQDTYQRMQRRPR